VTMLIGYARVSTVDQTLALQQDALTKAGCEKICTDTASGSVAERPGLAEALNFARSGDTLVVWRLDRLGRSLRHLIDTVATLDERGMHLRSLQEQLDTSTSGGKLVFHVFGALVEFERDLIRERTQAGLTAARARGKVGGRPRVKALNTPEKVQMAKALHGDKRYPLSAICRTLGVSRTTFYRYIKGQDEKVLLALPRAAPCRSCIERRPLAYSVHSKDLTAPSASIVQLSAVRGRLGACS
jgi:DNA invertase Pin-like site-specific DNA recombinase